VAEHLLHLQEIKVALHLHLQDQQPLEWSKQQVALGLHRQRIQWETTCRKIKQMQRWDSVDHKVDSQETSDHKVDSQETLAQQADQETSDHKVDNQETLAQQADQETSDLKVDSQETSDHKVDSQETLAHQVDHPET
jgi:hypothetical protein